MQVRRATLDDLPTLREFEQGVIATERPLDPTLAPDPIVYYDIEKLLASESCAFVVAVDGDTVVGCGYARIAPAEPYLAHREYAYLGLMFVRPSHRRRGVNRLVLDALTAWTNARGIREQRLEVYNDNGDAVRAYERAGFARHVVIMRRAT
jgi:GNAT superfamily N-acetyltransferase